MAKGLYIRTITAGRYCKVARYSRALPSDSKQARTAKQAATNKAQRFLNIRNATENLLWILLANFDTKDSCWVTCTFDEDHLPANRKHLRNISSSFFDKLRAEWKRHDRELKYVYIPEGAALAAAPDAQPITDQAWEIAPWRDKRRWERLDDPAPNEKKEKVARFHMHVFILLQKQDYETVRAFWPYGQVYINPIRTKNLESFERLAAYATKEARTGQRAKGERSYIPSLNIKKPSVTGRWCEDYEGIVMPPGAESLKSGSDRNDIYGSVMEYSFFRMKDVVNPPNPYKSKGRLNNPKPKRKSK
ncbi:MAG: hypothetical protein IJO56_05850 [Oscillospiraceae bacterium]|nr:hypothetical protein [Oscillospiraceae bacterium]